MPKTKGRGQRSRAHESRQTSDPDLFEQFFRLSSDEQVELLKLLEQLGPERVMQALRREAT